MQKVTLMLLLVFAARACPSNDEYCVFCIENQCQRCIASYLRDGKCVAPAKLVPNCAIYASDGVCKTCRYRYSVDKNGLCQPITIPECFEAKSETQCDFCKFHVLARNGVCAEANRCNIKNCDICKLESGVEVCAMCEPGYVLVVEGPAKYSCILEILSTANCLVVYTQDPSKCAICDFNYYWSFGRCLKTNKYALDMSAVSTKAILAILLGVFMLWG